MNRRPVALSTMWAQQDRFAGQPLAFAETARDLGFTHIEINYAMPPDVVDALAAGTVLPVSSLHQPAPRLDHGGRWNHDLNLASTDESERRAAIGYALQTIEIAADCGAAAVVVHLGGVGNVRRPEESRLRALCAEGVAAGQEVEQLRGDLRAWREDAAPPYLAAARRSLGELAAHARRRGVVLGLEDRYNFHEIPSIDETAMLLLEHGPEAVGYWHDTGHAEVMHRLGLVERGEWLRRLGPRTVGTHINDVDGVTDHRAPGEGTSPWDALLAGLPDAAIRVFEINQHRPGEALRRGLEVIAAAGFI